MGQFILKDRTFLVNRRVSNKTKYLFLVHIWA